MIQGRRRCRGPLDRVLGERHVPPDGERAECCGEVGRGRSGEQEDRDRDADHRRHRQQAVEPTSRVECGEVAEAGSRRSIQIDRGAYESEKVAGSPLGSVRRRRVGVVGGQSTVKHLAHRRQVLLRAVSRRSPSFSTFLATSSGVPFSPAMRWRGWSGDHVEDQEDDHRDRRRGPTTIPISRRTRSGPSDRRSLRLDHSGVGLEPGLRVGVESVAEPVAEDVHREDGQRDHRPGAIVSSGALESGLPRGEDRAPGQGVRRLDAGAEEREPRLEQHVGGDVRAKKTMIVEARLGRSSPNITRTARRPATAARRTLSRAGRAPRRGSAGDVGRVQEADDQGRGPDGSGGARSVRSSARRRSSTEPSATPSSRPDSDQITSRTREITRSGVPR